MARRGANGEGTIYRRKDGRYEGAAYVLAANGTRKRVRVYGATRAEVHSKLIEAKARDQQGVPVADKTWTLGAYLDYWLEEVVKPNRRATTYDLYESNVRLYIKPELGHLSLTRLTVPVVQRFLNQHLAAGHSVRKVQTLREVLSPALSRAVREELLTRNVARLVELPQLQRGDVRPWSAEEMTALLQAAQDHQWYPAFLLLALYGLRRGEVLGLRWRDVDLTNAELHVRQQVNRAGGRLQIGPLKTQSGRRDLPLLAAAADALERQYLRQQTARTMAGASWQGPGDGDELVLTTPAGGPVEPNNFTRAFQRITARHQIRRIKLHHVRHTAATMLKTLGVPARDAQLILGHSHISVTQQIYQHDTMDSRRLALGRMETALLPTLETAQADRSEASEGDTDGSRSRQLSRQKTATPSLADQIKPAHADKNKPATGVPVAGWLHEFFGDLTGNRTRIARMKTSNRGDRSNVPERVTEVDASLAARRRQWILGVVAVSAAVKTTEGDDIELAA